MAGVRLDVQTEERLNALAALTHRPKSYYLKEAMKAYLDAHEGALLALANYEEQVRKGTLKTIPMEDILKELKFDKSDLVD
ncbi:MAG: antitoxin, family [Alphaproteobacteria bacterium]|jgi:RHH-type rel operon transcriptional repressor/antitoxin RelB|nr:antitoxin, family [Alphaproteobacteria bacterium]